MMRAIPNTRASVTFAIPKPWDQWAEYPIPAEITDKAKMEAWRTSATTKHAFISGVVGLDPKRRVTDKGARNDEDNPPASMSAYIADCDAAISDERLEVCLADAPSPYVPTYTVKSFSQEGDSGRFKRRLVWVFERPIRLIGAQHAKQFYKVLADRLMPSKWIGGYDGSGHKHTMYFEIGRDWKPTGADPIPYNILLGWAAEAARGLRISDFKDRPAPNIEDIAAAVAEQFPGRWEGNFAEGSQGVRFWDPSADNPRGCIVGTHGMICFTGPKPFVSWEDIFGVQFVDELRGDSWGKFMDSVFFTPDPAKFWRFSEVTGRWRSSTIEELRRTLRVEGISAKRVNGSSEMDKLEEAIIKSNEVVAALPFIHRDSGVIYYNGERHLNTATYHVMPPAPEIDDATPYELDLWGPKYFPWVRLFYKQWFVPPRRRPFWVPEEVELADVPMILNLAWVSRVYQGAWRKNPPKRQALIIAGPPGVGKTFYVRGILGALLGGVADGTPMMVEGKDFTSVVAEKPINFIDDATPATSPEFHRRFTSLMKKMAANKSMHYNKKYGANGEVEWAGSTILALNVDPESQRSLPSLDQSNLDKTSMYQVQAGIHLPGEDEQSAILAKELPFFARFLLHWTPPDWVWAPESYRGRYGIRAYHHEDLREAASSSGVPHTLLDVLCDLIEEWRESPDAVSATLSGVREMPAQEGGRAWVWEGRSSRLYRELAVFAPQIIARLSNTQFTGALATLASRGFGIEKLPNGKWKVVFDDAMLSPFDPTVNTEYQS